MPVSSRLTTRYHLCGTATQSVCVRVHQLPTKAHHLRRLRSYQPFTPPLPVARYSKSHVVPGIIVLVGMAIFFRLITFILLMRGKSSARRM